MFYYDTYWRMWVRRLITTNGFYGLRHFDLSLTGNDWDVIREQRIRAHATSDSGNKFGELPTEIKARMFAALGSELALMLIEFNYIRELGTATIVEAHLGHAGGGVPLIDIIALKDQNR